MKKANKRSFISAQNALENVPELTDNNSNIKGVSAHHEQTNPFIL